MGELQDSQEILDTVNKQYSEVNIRNYETVFGKQFVSTGGESTMKKFVEMLNLKQDEAVLDFGSGLGAAALYMANQYMVNVCGMDASPSMIFRANKYLQEVSNDEKIRKNVKFQLGDGITSDFGDAAFDCIYSRETLVHIKEKFALLKKFHQWMKPGGRLLITDYCLGAPPSFSNDFLNYLKSRKYSMKTIPEFSTLLERAGFIEIKALDLTSECIKILHKDVENLLYVKKHEILNNMTRCEFDDLVDSWKSKLQRCVNGNQTYGLFMAKKAYSIKDM